MSLIAAFDIPVGASLSLTIPAGSGRVPGILWDNLALAALLDRDGYQQVAHETLSRLDAWLRVPDPVAIAWPGEITRPKGRKLLDADEPGDAALRWYVVRAATRQEKRAEDALVEIGFPVYVPRYIRWARHAGRKYRIERPLLPGYMFVGVRRATQKEHDDELQLIGSVEWVHDFVRFSKERAPIAAPFKEVRFILEQERAGEYDRTGKKREDPKKGDTVFITGGQFQGFPAEFVRRRPNDRIEVFVQMFGRWSAILLNPEHVDGCSDEDD